MITQAFDLNLIPGGVKPIVKASQYDAGSRTLAISLFNGVTAFTIPSGAQVLIQGTKKDGTGFQYECTFAGNVVTAEVAQQMTVFAGPVEVELQILSGGEVLGTGNFILQVEQAALADDTVISETDIPIIQRIPEYAAEAQGAAEEASLWNDNGGDSGQSTPGPTNNAYYWSLQAQQAAGGGVTSFNGRTGTVVPAAGDYNAEQVSYNQSTTAKQEIDSKLSKNGDSKDNTTTFTSSDNATIFNSGDLGGQSGYAWEAVAQLASAETHASLFGKMSKMFKNIRTIAKLLGTTDISAIGNGTVSGALSTLNGNINGTINSTAVYVADIATLTNTGRYYLEVRDTSDIFTSGSTYLLEVFRTTFRNSVPGYVQRISSVYPSNGRTWQRSYYAVGGWSAWIELSNQ